MEFNTRRDQFSYFVGFVARTQRSHLHKAEKKLIEAGYPNVVPEMAFEFCPFNDTHESIIRNYTIRENRKISDLSLRIYELIEEYLCLVSDFEPPCCGDGRTFYQQNPSMKVVLVCDRCETIYSLDGYAMDKINHVKMKKADFVGLFGEETALDWPFHSRLRKLLSVPSS